LIDDSSKMSSLPAEPKLLGRRPEILMIAVAFLLRVAFMVAWHTYRFADSPGHFAFGFETGSIAGAIARGEGFSSPFGVPNTGPTAWLAPIYPYMVAAIFRLFGLFSTSSAVVILTINSCLAALTCWPIYRIGNQVFGRTVALIAGWTWAAAPFFFRWAITWVWDTSLSALLTAVAVWIVLDSTQLSWRRWAALGVFAGFSSLVNPSLLTLFPLLAIWAAWKLRRATAAAAGQLLLFLLLMVMVISPWLVRNRVVFGKWVFLRSNAGFEFCLGNFGGAPGVPWGGGHPTGNPGMMNQYRRMGEIPFVEMKQKLALHWVNAHRLDFARTTLQRVADFWDGGELRYERDPPWHPWMVLATSAPALLGLMFATLRRFRNLGPILIVMLVYPIPYYVTLTAPRFRHPIEPFMVILMGYFAVLMYEELQAALATRKAKTQVLTEELMS
jgi:4-amino-4-deoxy-L-arabinose transferase-like glycosyltransferase